MHGKWSFQWRFEPTTSWLWVSFLTTSLSLKSFTLLLNDCFSNFFFFTFQLWWLTSGPWFNTSSSNSDNSRTKSSSSRSRTSKKNLLMSSPSNEFKTKKCHLVFCYQNELVNCNYLIKFNLIKEKLHLIFVMLFLQVELKKERNIENMNGNVFAVSKCFILLSSFCYLEARYKQLSL